MNEKRSNLTEDELKVGQYIQKIEDLKDNIIEYLNYLTKLDDTTKNLWISDIKEFYYNLSSAWMKLEHKNLEDSKNFLYGARNLLSKIISELKIFQNENSLKLVENVEKLFKKCWDAFWIVFKISITEEITAKSRETVIKVSDLKYHLVCAECGKIAVEFKIGYGRFDKKESLVFRGITHERSLNIKLAYELFEIFGEKNLLGIHNFMKKYHGYEGLDAFCPECNKIYCWEHYDAREEYDEGFYDCTYGICPNGHKRIIDD
ncbi:MAG: hypothetical protein JSV62_14245 [Promethearchaeota archaeon]|nr:MAG: hypothetical protein JSV62_14245 [Candidatus Lokiarchaeota archaeon]